MRQKDIDAPALADGTGYYREHRPTLALRGHFQCIWINRVASNHEGAVAVVPDGCIDLLWRNGRLFVAGPDITVARPVLSAGSFVLGARFRAGAAARWLGLPMSEIVGRTVDMADLWGSRQVDDIIGRAGNSASTGAQAGHLLQALTDRAASVAEPDPAAARMFAWLGQGLGSAEPVGVLRQRLDMSERTLLRRSREHFGYGPKMLDRILRFQRFQAIARDSAASGLAGMAAEAGFADQAHLSREMRSLCDMSAGDFVRQLAG